MKAFRVSGEKDSTAQLRQVLLLMEHPELERQAPLHA